MEFDESCLGWMDEKVERLEKNNWLYKIICLLLFKPRKKLTYKELYIILRGINEAHLGEKDADRRSFVEIMKVYSYNHKKVIKDVDER